MELNIDSKLSNARKKLVNIIYFPFVCLDEENNEISPKDEISNTLMIFLWKKFIYQKKNKTKKNFRW